MQCDVAETESTEPGVKLPIFMRIMKPRREPMHSLIDAATCHILILNQKALIQFKMHMCSAPNLWCSRTTTLEQSAIRPQTCITADSGSRWRRFYLHSSGTTAKCKSVLNCDEFKYLLTYFLTYNKHNMETHTHILQSGQMSQRKAYLKWQTFITFSFTNEHTQHMMLESIVITNKRQDTYTGDLLSSQFQLHITNKSNTVSIIYQLLSKESYSKCYAFKIIS